MKDNEVFFYKHGSGLNHREPPDIAKSKETPFS